MLCLADDQQVLVGYLIGRYVEVEWRRTLADASGAVVVRTVARAKVAVEVSGVGERHAAQMGANAEQDEPLGALCTLFVGLRIAKYAHVDGSLSLYLGR